MNPALKPHAQGKRNGRPRSRRRPRDRNLRVSHVTIRDCHEVELFDWLFCDEPAMELLDWLLDEPAGMAKTPPTGMALNSLALMAAIWLLVSPRAWTSWGETQSRCPPLIWSTSPVWLLLMKIPLG